MDPDIRTPYDVNTPPQKPVPEPDSTYLDSGGVSLNMPSPNLPQPSIAELEAQSQAATVMQQPLPTQPSQLGNVNSMMPVIPPKKRKIPKLAIVIAIAVALLIGIAVAAVFLGSKKKPTPTQPTAAVKDETKPITPTDMDDIVKEVDQNLNASNDTQDFSITDLDNKALGIN